MSFVLLKNLIFMRKGERHIQQTQDAKAPTSVPSGDGEKAGQLASATSERSSESSWLSCNSSVDLEAQTPQARSSSQKASYLSNPKKWVSQWHVADVRGWRPSGRMISDAIIGLSDGLTVPFALTAGLATIGDVRLVVLGGVAELVAGALSMGLGGWLGARSEA